MTPIVVVLIVLGGVLPLVGLFRVAVRAYRNLPNPDQRSSADHIREGTETGLFSVEPLRRAAEMTDSAPVLEWSGVRWDILFVGSGVLCGTVGSAWAVFL
ncbi:hypothetical protein [Planctomonas psychrotolerans]|uniref:hypothetical protein n=1 Tax=Planctomonas psychrotolerans TaxID=2528712 RepID=UPI0012397CBA|nr:hypothetical protein [Planctomonas psychrotolerans]